MKQEVKFFKESLPEWKCSCPLNSRELVKICASTGCKRKDNALVCGDMNCGCEKKYHEKCQNFLSYKSTMGLLHGYNKKIIPLLDPIIKQIERMINNLIEMHAKIQKEMSTFSRLAEIKFITTDLNGTSKISSKAAQGLFQLLQLYPKLETKLSQQKLADFSREINKKLENINRTINHQEEELWCLIKSYDREFESDQMQELRSNSQNVPGFETNDQSSN